AAILAQDGITTGAIYALLSLALVLVFSVTRVIYIPQGEFVAFGALTLAGMQTGRFPHAATLLLGLALACFAIELVATLRSPQLRRDALRTLSLAAVKFVIAPALIWLLA